MDPRETRAGHQHFHLLNPHTLLLCKSGASSVIQNIRVTELSPTGRDRKVSSVTCVSGRIHSLRSALPSWVLGLKVVCSSSSPSWVEILLIPCERLPYRERQRETTHGSDWNTPGRTHPRKIQSFVLSSDRAFEGHGGQAPHFADEETEAQRERVLVCLVRGASPWPVLTQNFAHGSSGLFRCFPAARV